MIIRTFKTIENAVYVVSINTEDWSEQDRKLMAFYGEPSVDLGGTFDDYADVQYTLPTISVRIMSEMPGRECFDTRDDADAEARALLWAQTIADRITAEVTTLRTRTDTYTGELVANV